MGHAVRLEDGRIRASKNFIANLERAEVNRVGKAMAAERGLTFTTAKTGDGELNTNHREFVLRNSRVSGCRPSVSLKSLIPAPVWFARWHSCPS